MICTMMNFLKKERNNTTASGVTNNIFDITGPQCVRFADFSRQLFRASSRPVGHQMLFTDRQNVVLFVVDYIHHS